MEDIIKQTFVKDDILMFNNFKSTVDIIMTGDRIRPVDQSKVDELANDIERVGMYHPLVVMPIGGGRYKLLSGMHRYLAVKQLYEREVVVTLYCRVVHITKDNEQYVEISENLVRNDLSKEQRAMFAGLYAKLTGSISALRA